MKRPIRRPSPAAMPTASQGLRCTNSSAPSATTLAFSATQNNDKIGLILFSDAIELYIPPKKGRSHVLRIIRDLIEFEPKSRQTNIVEAMKFLQNHAKFDLIRGRWTWEKELAGEIVDEGEGVAATGKDDSPVKSSKKKRRKVDSDD